VTFQPPDEIDRAIIRLLQIDGRKPFTEIAAAIGVSEGTVRQRVKRLVGDQTLQVVGIVDPKYMGWDAAGVVAVTVKSGLIDEVAAEIAKFPEVSYLFMASGEFDLFVEVYCQDQDHLVRFLNDDLQQIPGILRTQTFMILKLYKLSYRWGEAT
jgi:Lrp/AsnC family transcriptional regulator for asnA, asnC and gidA